MPQITASLADANGASCYACDPEIASRAVAEFPSGFPICFRHLGRELKQIKDPKTRAQIKRLFIAFRNVQS